jgi:flagellar motor switch protein FliM
MIDANNDIRLPFNADLVRSKGVNLSQQLEMLLPFAEAMAEQISAALTNIGGVPIKVSLVSAQTEKLKPHLQSEAGFNIVGDATVVSCWNQSNPDFDNLMCEICLGGSGELKSSEPLERPATAIDKKLRLWVNEHIVRATANALCDIGEHTGLTVQSRARVAARKNEGALLCYRVVLLLNVFDDACEFELLLNFEECLKLIGGITLPAAAEPSSAGLLMEKTSFSVEVFLRPDIVDVRQILNLAPGEVLKLNVTASTPVELRLNGQKLSLGNLRYDQNGGHIRLLDSVPFVSRPETQVNSSTLAGQYGN